MTKSSSQQRLRALLGADQNRISASGARPPNPDPTKPPLPGIFVLGYPGQYSGKTLKFRAIETIGAMQRHEDLRLLQTAKLTFDNGEEVALFADPTQRVHADLQAAESKLQELVDRLAMVEKNLNKKIEDIKVELGITLDRGDFAAHAKLAQEATRVQAQVETARAHHGMEIRQARVELERTTANKALLEKGIAYRHLQFEPRGGLLDDNVIASEDIQIDLATAEWNGISLAVLPLNALRYIVPIELPDAAAWATERFEALDPKAPASAGIAASELHEMFLREHNLRVDQFSGARFGKVMKEAGWAKKDCSSGNRYMLTVKLTEQQREAQLRAEFTAEKAAQERAEFEQWKASRAAAGAAGAGG